MAGPRTVKDTTTEKVATGEAQAGKLPAAAHLAVPALSTILQAIPSKWERHLQEKYRRGVASPELTAEQLGGAGAISAASEREARALAARGSAKGGRSGMNLERARLARKAGLDKLAAYLRSQRGGNLGRYAADVQAHSKLGETLTGLALKRKQDLWRNLVGVPGEARPEGWLGDPALVDAFKTLGRSGRGTEGRKRAGAVPLKPELSAVDKLLAGIGDISEKDATDALSATGRPVKYEFGKGAG